MENFKPVVVLKPSSNELENSKNFYTIKKELFTPTPETVINFLNFLNQFEVGKKSGIQVIDDKIFNNYIFKQVKPLTMNDIENLADKNSCNVLGGVFLAYLETFGLNMGTQIKEIAVNENSVAFLTTLYPDLTRYFYEPIKLSDEQKEFAKGVISNNTGSFKVIDIENNIRIFDIELLKKIALLKRIFRYGAKMNVPFKMASVRCNLVHSPENIEELTEQLQLFNT